MDTIGDLVVGMVLEGVVTNVAAFGAFVDVGVHQDGLVHVSALSTKFVKDPREVVKPGDVVTCKVVSVDVPRKRIGLSLRLDDEAQLDPWRRPGRPGRPGWRSGRWRSGARLAPAASGPARWLGTGARGEQRDGGRASPGRAEPLSQLSQLSR